MAKKIYKPTNNKLRTSSNTSRANHDNTLRINKGTGYDNHRVLNVVEARENVGTPMVQQSGIQCYNFKEYGHVARECQKPKRAKDAAYHKEKMLLCKQEEAGLRLSAEQVVWRDDTDDEPGIRSTLSVHGINSREEQGNTNITIDSLDMCANGDMVDQDDDDLAKESDLPASLIEKLKCEINDSKTIINFWKHQTRL
nr:hypothetical protein [Tanacetum cinerariifolium]